MNALPHPKPNPRVLTWARHESGFEISRPAKRIGVKPEQLVAWESGDKAPTVRQLHELAKFYQRPLSIFFGADAPSSAPLAAEYRRLPNVAPGAESPELRFALRDMIARQQTTRELYEELGYEIPNFRLTAHQGETPREVGARIRAASGITVDQTFAWKDVWQSWREWRIAIEGLDILVFMFPKVDLTEARGLALPHPPLPVIAVNTKELPEARAFTAIHELVHLMLANGQEESTALYEKRTPDEWLAIERFAEVAASYALIDEDTLAQLVSGGSPSDLEAIRRLASRFKVTPLAMATRLRQSGFITWDQYGRWRAMWDEYVSTLPPRKGGFATPVDKTLGRAGRGFSQLVLEALDTNRITMADATQFLNLRTDKFEELRRRLLAGRDVEAINE
jgi:Zn-dependent peptidase ImmA (M78 family)/transcriptional regulator with XRE-family HTH domain